MAFYLSILFLLNGQIVHGPESEGWGPRLQPSWEVCQERKAFLEEHWAPWIIEQGAADKVVVSCTLHKP